MSSKQPSEPKGDAAEFEAETGLVFKDKALLKMAFTHSSFARHRKADRLEDNERLEFLGDAVLKLIVSDYLYSRFSDYDEGELTKLRSKIIADKTLALLAERIHLGKYILFSFGEIQTGGANRSSNLANAFEAVVGAYFLDRGLKKTRDFFIALLEKHSEYWQSHLHATDYKSLLQEYLQKHRARLPKYSVFKEEGPAHEKRFHVEVDVTLSGGGAKAHGDGHSKKDAEQIAAKNVLARLGYDFESGDFRRT